MYAIKSDVTINYAKRLFEQSQIRGKHATGISFIKDGYLHTIKRAISSKEFINTFDFDSLPKVLNFIGHCRYSTSDLRFNQPIHSNDISIVHNGVISQKSSDLREEEFGYKCSEKNDSELILKSVEAGNSPIIEFKNKSISALVLSKDKLNFFRNGNRPLWYCKFNGGIYVASTKDILIRAIGDHITPIKCKAGTIYSIKDGKVISTDIDEEFKDEQAELDCSFYYGKVDL